MHSMYVEIPQAFAEANVGTQVNENVFNYAVTNDGRCVCSPNSISEFEEIFNELMDSGWVPVEEELSITDFPQPVIDE